jgi:hypothetical protein
LRTGGELHFSFILNKNRIVCYSANNYEKQNLNYRFGKYLPTRNPESNKYVAGRHSEAEVCRIFLNKFGHLDVSGLTLFNVRISRGGLAVLSKPCPNCERIFIEPLNWKEVTWTE